MYYYYNVIRNYRCDRNVLIWKQFEGETSAYSYLFKILEFITEAEIKNIFYWIYYRRSDHATIFYRVSIRIMCN